MRTIESDLVYNNVSPEFNKKRHPRHGYNPSNFLFIFVTEVFIDISLPSFENRDIQVCSEKNLSGLEYAVDVILLNGDSSSLEVVLIVFTIMYVCSGCVLHRRKSNMLLQELMDSKLNLFLQGTQIHEVDRSGWSGWCILHGGRKSADKENSIGIH